MPISFDRFLVTETLAVAALNAGMNAAYTSWQWSGGEPLAFAGVATDLATTPVFIALLSTLLGTAGARRKLATGLVAQPRSGVQGLAWLPQGILSRALALALAAALVLAMPLYIALIATGIDSMTLGAAVGAKVAITLFFSVLIVPLGLLAAAGDVRCARSLRLTKARRAMP